MDRALRSCVAQLLHQTGFRTHAACCYTATGRPCGKDLMEEGYYDTTTHIERRPVFGIGFRLRQRV